MSVWVEGWTGSLFHEWFWADSLGCRDRYGGRRGGGSGAIQIR